MTQNHYSVLHAPMNFANQPMMLVKELRRRGIESNHIQYSSSGEHRLGYELDKVYKFSPSRLAAQFGALRDSIEFGYDIYHFWQRSLVFEKNFKGLTGIDLPIIKGKGGKVIHRATGFDVRIPSLDLKYNRFSPFRNGYKYPFDEKTQVEFQQMISDYVDLYLVQDPELQQFVPNAKILPRAIDLTQWEYTGIKHNDKPLVVHAPTNPAFKGSPFIQKAIEDLESEGLKFDYKYISGMKHDEAVKWYRKADIIIDQILIGATGVLTLEALALGKPCIVYLREDLFRPFYGQDLPVANANPDTVKDVLRGLIKDYEWRAELSKNGRILVEHFHDVEKVGDRCIEIYNEVLRDRAGPPRQGTADIDFFQSGLLGAKVISYRDVTLSALVKAIVLRLPSRILIRLLAAKESIQRLHCIIRKFVTSFRGKLDRSIKPALNSGSKWAETNASNSLYIGIIIGLFVGTWLF